MGAPIYSTLARMINGADCNPVICRFDSDSVLQIKEININMNLSEVTLDSVFDTTTTGKKKYDNIMNDPETYSQLGYTTEIKMMSPERAIAMMAKGQNKSVFQITKRRMAQGGQEKIDQFANDMSKGTQFDMPSMFFQQGGFMQDGYHRLMAADKLGIKKVPVLIIKKK